MDLSESVVTGKWLEAQYSVLGSMLIDNRCVPIVMYENSESDFQGVCKTLFRAIRKMFLAGEVIDPVTVMDAVGGAYRDFILQLMEITPTAAHVERYAKLCKQQSRTTRLRDIARQMVEEGNPEKLRKLLDEANTMMVDRSNARSYSMEDLLKRFMERHTGPTNYLKWPIPDLNREIYASPGSYIIIGGAPSAGKTMWALQCANFWGKEKKVGFFSLETDKDTLFDRHVSSTVEINKNDIKNNEISQNDWDKLCLATSKLIANNLRVIQASEYTVADIRAQTMAEGYEIIFVDYLQLIAAEGENRTAQVTSISIALHGLAQSLGVTVVALSQVNRELGKNDNRSQMSRLRESGQIEQDADVIMILSLSDPNNYGGSRILNIAKNKEGTRGQMVLAFDGVHQTFSKPLMNQEVISDLKKAASEQNRINREAEQRERDEQMTLLSEDTELPFKD